MAYVVHFLPLGPDTDWLDALEAQEQQVLLEAERGVDQPVDIVRADWWRIASLTYRILPDLELRRNRSGLAFVDHASGIVLELGVKEITLSLPYRHDETRALEALRAAQRIARFIEEETGLVAFDVQLECPFLDSDEALARGAALIASTKRALARTVMLGGHRDAGDTSANRPRVR